MNVWTWKGKYFGYIESGRLWTAAGQHVGNVRDDIIYGRNGNYLGEVRSDNRLITHRSKTSRRVSSFTPLSNRVGRVRSVGYVGYVMISGYEDFPSPESFS